MKPWTHLIDPAWDRFLAKVDAPCPFSCWLWLGAQSRGGDRSGSFYGTFTINRAAGLVVRALAFMCEAAGIEVPPGMTRDHLCGNTLCVNPLHVEVVTNSENARRGSVAFWRRRRAA